jgi:recombination associated protein RdgC
VQVFNFKRLSVFKNALIYRIAPTWTANLELMEAALEGARYVECGASQEKAVGWTEPRGEANGVLAESVAGQIVLKFMVEVKAVPSSVVNRKAKEELAKIEASTGLKPGKRETKEIKEDIKLSLMPLAFTKLSSVLVWIDAKAQLLTIGASSTAKADEVITYLVKCLDGFSVMPLNTQTSSAVAMGEWLSTKAPPAGFTIDRECELKSPDESKAVVRYSRHPLDIEEVSAHITSGKVPTKLALIWMDRVSFVLTDTLQIKKIAFLEGVFDGTSQEKEDGFDADTAIATGELRQLIPELVSALGGEMQI